MQIFVVNNNAAAEQARAYAEYRVFAGLASSSRLVQDVEVRLSSAGGVDAKAHCVVSVRTTSGKRAWVRARGGHAYQAIDRAADRIREVVKRLGAPEPESPRFIRSA